MIPRNILSSGSQSGMLRVVIIPRRNHFLASHFFTLSTVGTTGTLLDVGGCPIGLNNQQKVQWSCMRQSWASMKSHILHPKIWIIEAIIILNFYTNSRVLSLSASFKIKLLCIAEDDGGIKKSRNLWLWNINVRAVNSLMSLFEEERD